MLPDLESLRCFCAAAKHLNFRVAARSVGLSPAAFGDRIKRLEELLEARLFDRTTRRVALTAQGERLVGQAQRTLSEAERCHDVVLSDRPRPFSLTIGTRFELGMSWLTPALGELERSQPERQLHLFFGDTPALLDAVNKGIIDCLISSARITAAGLSYARLHEERYVFVGSRKLLERTPLKRREHAARHTLLELHADLPLFRYFLDARPGGEVWAFDRTQHLGTIGPVRARVLEGAGVAVLPHYFVKHDLDKKRLALILPSVEMPVDWFRLVWQRDHPRHEQLHSLADELSRLPLK